MKIQISDVHKHLFQGIYREDFVDGLYAILNKDPIKESNSGHVNDTLQHINNFVIGSELLHNIPSFDGTDVNPAMKERYTKFKKGFIPSNGIINMAYKDIEYQLITELSKDYLNKLMAEVTSILEGSGTASYRSWIMYLKQVMMYFAESGYKFKI